MEILLDRICRKETYTIGHFYINNTYFCDTVEDKDRDLNKNGKFDNGETKVYGLTAIPNGRYLVKLTYSPNFKRVLPEIINVNSFSGIRIHSGNFASDSLGCVIVGENKVKGGVINSKVYEKKLIEILKKVPDGEQIWITVK